MIERQMSVPETWYWSLMEAVMTCGDPMRAQTIAVASIDEWRSFTNRRAEMVRKEAK
jgi:hypothetical protein